MSVALYMDENVHSAVTAGLRSRGVDVLTVQDDGMSGAADPLILDRSLALRRVLFTQDQDFLVEGAQRLQTGEAFAGIVFSRQEFVSMASQINDLELIAKVYDAVDVANQIIHIPF